MAGRLKIWDGSNWVYTGYGSAGTLSSLTIDADKDWNGKAISNIHDIIPSTTDTYSLGSATLGWARVYSTEEQTVYLSAQGGIPRTTNGCQTQTKLQVGTTGYVNIIHLAFDATASEYAQWVFALPNNIVASPTFKAQFIWTAASSSGTVTWGCQMRVMNDDDVIDAAYGTAQTVTDTLIATNDTHITSQTAAITPAGTLTSPGRKLVSVQVYRDIADTLAADALLIGVMLEYTVQYLGS